MGKGNEFEDRELSRFVKDICSLLKLPYKDMACALKVSEPYFNNKLHRNAFTVEDFQKIAKAFDAKIIITKDGLNIEIPNWRTTKSECDNPWEAMEV